MINSYFLKSTVWAKLNIPAGWKWFVEVQCVTSVRGITPSKKKKSNENSMNKSRGAGFI